MQVQLLNPIWIFFSYFGDIAYWLGFAVSFLLIYPFLEKKDRERQKWILIYLLPTVLLSYAATFFLKFMFKIPRICEGIEGCLASYSFPSGHATIAFAFALSLFLNFKRRPKIYIPAFILALLVSYSRLALKVHTFYDILGGFFVGVSVSLFWHYFFKKILCCKGENFLFRKFIHLSALIFVFFYFKIPSFYLFLFSLAITTIFGISEVFRMRNYYFPVIQEITLLCKKKDEKGFLIEPFLFGLSISILFLLPKELFLIGSLPLIVGDGFAGVIGYKFGKHKIPWNKQKTLEGSLAFFFVSLISLAIFFNIYISFLISILATIIESALKKRENFLLPMSLIAIAKIFGLF